MATLAAALALALSLLVPAAGSAHGTTRGNPACPGEDVFYNPGNGEDIVVPPGYQVEVFAKDLNFPSGIAFVGNKRHFRAYVIESGSGLPGRRNDPKNPAFGGVTSSSNPMTPDIRVFDQQGEPVRGPLGKPTAGGGGFDPTGPAIDLGFERGMGGGRLFATNASATPNNGRIVLVDPKTGAVSRFIGGLPSLVDHPTEQLEFRDGWIYWSQGSATNTAVVGHDNAMGRGQHDIPCQDVTLSQNTWSSGDGHLTSGYSPHGVARPGAVVKAFEGASRPGICTGAILRARLDAGDPGSTIEPFSWGYRNPFGIRFSPQRSPLRGGLFITENGEDLRGARPVNNAPDRLQVARQTTEGTPDYHGWPDQFGFLDSTQRVFDPVPAPAEDDPAAVVGKPVQRVLAFPPQLPVGPLALDPADAAVVGNDFAPTPFTSSLVRRDAALIAREGPFGFGPPNGVPNLGHDVELANFGEPLSISTLRFAFNCPQGEQAATPNGLPTCGQLNPGEAFAERLRAINRPVDAKFGPDGALYVADYGAVRDLGQADPRTMFTNPADMPLVQIPRTGVIWRISRVDDD
jgi:glucose/arabinose dehydrogenase